MINVKIPNSLNWYSFQENEHKKIFFVIAKTAFYILDEPSSERVSRPKKLTIVGNPVTRTLMMKHFYQRIMNMDM